MYIVRYLHMHICMQVVLHILQKKVSVQCILLIHTMLDAYAVWWIYLFFALFANKHSFLCQNFAYLILNHQFTFIFFPFFNNSLQLFQLELAFIIEINAVLLKFSFMFSTIIFTAFNPMKLRIKIGVSWLLFQVRFLYSMNPVRVFQ